MVHLLLRHLPSDRHYRVIFMRRNLDEVLVSQRRMLDRQGRVGGDLSDQALKRTYERQLERIDQAISTVTYPRVIRRVGKSPPQYSDT